MKKIIIYLALLFTSNVFSQTDSSYKTDNVFLISYLDFNKEIKEVKDAKLTSIDSVSLSFEEIILGQNSNLNKNIPHTIVFDKINSFGYKVGTNFGIKVLIGTGVGFGAGFILGACSGGYSPGDGPPSDANKLGLAVLLGFAGAVPGALIGAATGIGSKEYEVLDISKYNRQKKFEIIKRLIRNEVKENE